MNRGNLAHRGIFSGGILSLGDLVRGGGGVLSMGGSCPGGFCPGHLVHMGLWCSGLIFTAAIGVRIPVVAVKFHNVYDYTIVRHPFFI